MAVHSLRTGWMVVAGLVPAVLAAAPAVWADDSAQAQPAATTQSGGYQPVSVPSGGIIGYKPIPNSAIEAAMSGTSAPAQAVAAYPSAAPGSLTFNGGVGGVPEGVSTPIAPASGAAGAQGQLPLSYQFGLVGEGFYTLGRDDVVQIDVRGQPEFSGIFVVGFDGRLQYSYLGDIPVAGLTKFELQQVLEKLLVKYIRVPSVSVTIVGYNSKVVYVIGEVSRPGKFIMRGDAIKLREAILAAGLPTRQAALSRVHVIKPHLDDPEIRIINIKRILYKGELKDDVDLHTGEIVVIPSTVMSKINDFVAGLFSPINRAARIAAIAAL